VKAAKGGQVEFRAEKAGIVHAGIGKVSFSEEALVENVRAFVGASAAPSRPASGNVHKEGELELHHGAGAQIGSFEHRRLTPRCSQGVPPRAACAVAERGNGRDP